MGIGGSASTGLFPFPLHIYHEAVEVTLSVGIEINIVEKILRTHRPVFADAIIDLEPVAFVIGTATTEV